MARTINNRLENITVMGIQDIIRMYNELKPLYSMKRSVSWVSEWMCILSFLSLNNEFSAIKSLLEYSLSITNARPPEPDFLIINSRGVELCIEITKITTEPFEMLISESQKDTSESVYLDIPTKAYTQKGIPKDDVMKWRKQDKGPITIREDDEMPIKHEFWVKKCFENICRKSKSGRYSRDLDILILDDRYWDDYALLHRKSRFSRLASSRVLETIPNVNIPTIITASDRCLGIIRLNNNWVYELMSRS